MVSSRVLSSRNLWHVDVRGRKQRTGGLYEKGCWLAGWNEGNIGTKRVRTVRRWCREECDVL